MELSGRELDAALARGLGLPWEPERLLTDAPECKEGFRHQGAHSICWICGVRYREEEQGFLPPFHRSLDATVEHCGPWLRERNYAWDVSGFSDGSFQGAVWRIDGPIGKAADTPALALARAVLAAMEAEFGPRFWEVAA